VLNDLLEDSRNTIYVMSGRGPGEVDQLFRLVPNVGLIAENGCFIKDVDSNDWTELADRESTKSWKESVKNILQYYLERTPGAEIEERQFSLIFHYKHAEDFANAERQASDWVSHVNESCEGQRVHAIQLENSVVVESIDYTKETAAEKVYKRLITSGPYADKAGPIDFLMVVGDGREDEKVFKWANSVGAEKAVKQVVTVSLGQRSTEATATLTQGISGESCICPRARGSLFDANIPVRCARHAAEACFSLLGR
jgi:trehalose 6-phosphate synthase complex regulatory subunit